MACKAMVRCASPPSRWTAPLLCSSVLARRQHQDLVRRRVADPDAAVGTAAQAVDLGTLDAPFLEQLTVARIEAEDTPTVRLGHAEAAAVPEHAMRARWLERNGPQQLTGLSVDVLDLVRPRPADPQCSTHARPSVLQPSDRRRVQLRLLLGSRGRLLAGLVRPPL